MVDDQIREYCDEGWHITSIKTNSERGWVDNNNINAHLYLHVYVNRGDLMIDDRTGNWTNWKVGKFVNLPSHSLSSFDYFPSLLDFWWIYYYIWCRLFVMLMLSYLLYLLSLTIYLFVIDFLIWWFMLILWSIYCWRLVTVLLWC